MYYILYEGLKIESNEPIYCTMYSVHCCTMYVVSITKTSYNLGGYRRSWYYPFTMLLTSM